MMGIAQKVARNFSDAVRARGQSYFIKGRVTVIAARAGEVVARVRGTAKYRVRLRMRGPKLLASCTCPYFSPQGEPCKHLWATLLLVEARGLLQSPPVFPVHLVTESPRRSSLPGLPEPGGEPARDRDLPQQPAQTGTELGMEMIGLRPLRPIGPGGHGGKSKGKDRGIRRDPPGEPGSWSQRGSPPRDYRTGTGGRPRTKAGGMSSGPARTKAVNRNAKRLLVYVLDVAATLAQNQVVIDLARRQRKTTGEWGPLRPWYYAPHAAHVKYDPEDRLLLALLDEAQGGTPQGATFSASPSSDAGPGSIQGPSPRAGINNGAHAPRLLNASNGGARASNERVVRGMRRFVLRKDQAALVERLAKTNRLRLRRTEGEEDPPTIRWDDGQPWRFALEIRP